MNVALYARVSTRNQCQEQGVDSQITRLLTYAGEQGWAVGSELIFRDDGYSGANLSRPGLAALRAKVAVGEVMCLLISAPDRLARNYVHQVLLLEEFEHAGCELVFLECPMSSDPHDQLLLQIRGAVAEYERSLIAERMRRGRLAKLKAGLLLPWTQAPYGYQLDPDSPRDPKGVRLEEAEAPVVRELFSLYANHQFSLVGLVKHLHQQGILSPNKKER